MESLVSFDGAADVFNHLISKLSDATGWIANHSTPQREAVNTYIKSIQEGPYDPLTKAALISNARKIIREYSNQQNIVQFAEDALKPSARPQAVDDTWLAQFMDKARHICHEDFQLIWGKILAEECNNPNSIPKGVLHVLEQMDSEDAVNFSRICSVSVGYTDNRGSLHTPIILFNREEPFYGITFDALIDLQALGLIEIDLSEDDPYVIEELIPPGEIHYYDETYYLPEGVTSFASGNVIFTRIGESLCKVITVEKVDGFFQKYCVPLWESKVIR